LVSKDLIDSFTKKSAGSIVKFITKGDVEWITLLDPHNDKLLNQINSIIETIAHNIEENDKLTELRDFLLPMLMNGQVTVR
jgi:type I restriction enzyme S subunit